MKAKSEHDIMEKYKIKIQSMDAILHQISRMDQAENEQDLAQIIPSLLQAMGKYTDADRVYVFDWTSDVRECLSNTYEWCAAGVKPEIDNLQAVPISLMPSWMERFEKRETIVIADMESVKEAAPTEYEFLTAQQIHSLIAVPIYANHTMNGFIGVDNPCLDQNEISINLLSDVGGHLGCVRENLKNNRRLKTALENATKNAEIISSLATLYTTIFYGNIQKRTYELLEGEASMYHVTGKTGRLEDVVEQIMETFISSDMRQDMLDFLNVDTLTSRLQNTNSIMIEFEGVDHSWRQARFIVKSRDQDGTAQEVLYVARDITEEKKQEMEYHNQLKKSALDAERANLSKTAFLRRMSHDIRTPLNGIIGMIRIAEKYNDNVEKLHECRKKVLHSTDYLLDLINNVLDISKLESGSLILENKPFDLFDLLDKQMTVAETNAYENGVRFENGSDKAAIQHRKLIGSPLYLNRILMNLTSNAVKYNHLGGTVRLSCRELWERDDRAVFEFVCADTGLGMSREFQKHAFEPFTQEGKKSTTSFSGSGLGLSIVKDIVEMMDGSIKLESEENVGTTFTVTIPFEIDHYAEAEADQTDSERALDLKGRKALLVEDNELNMEISRTLLEDEGMDITMARNGREAVERMKQSSPNTFDFIFMDIMMPVMDGLEATRQIRLLERPDAQTVPIIAMTANAFEEDRKACLEAGMNEHISKPVNINDIKKAILKYKK